MILYCSHCGQGSLAARDPDKGYICCADCGKVLDDNVYSEEPTFEKTGDGSSRLAGNIIRSIEDRYAESYRRRLNRGRDEINEIITNLQIGGGDNMINRALAFYQIAVDNNFIKGRNAMHIAASCLYLACRQTKKAYLLIDFSDYLQINVYVLGAVFLQLCKHLRLWDHPIVQKLVDPSLFIHRFTESLLGRKNNAVSATALRIVASMKRDWMQTGRKPSGLCGAALYISALSHGLSYSKSDIVAVVHVCEATLTRRLMEFENTESGCLTIEEFLAKADELDEESCHNQFPRSGELLCKHKGTKESHFAHGLCEKCYNKFIKMSGGLQGGSEPPAFQRAEKQRQRESEKEGKLRESSQLNLGNDSSQKQEAKFCSENETNWTGDVSMLSQETEKTGRQTADSSVFDESQNASSAPVDEHENFSDIDDVEVDGYLLHNEEEKQYKKIIWEEMNKEYLEEQAAKEAAAAAAKKAQDALLANLSGEYLSSEDLAAATAAALAKSRKERRQKRAEEAKNSAPAQTPLEATYKMLKRKTFSSKINYKALENLYRINEDDTKRQRTESEADAGIAADNDQKDKKSTAFDSGDADDVHEADTFDDIPGPNDDGHNEYHGNEDEYYGNEDEDYGYDDDFVE
ncbi:transcription factor IIIB 60 kDa subunit isoform X2 [Dioscorea cayenensis subsp. rotundata]|uniref:Transcription factor IIIB 60 kDa subunit isoform X1 n=1 Tax=Dioscorea cayennensis subsp. rotundata TaxID=55577 RepID=A0AB40BG55_DIOCR|nr:transcription factor IIIB 60 kDa subunit isoform X1 [Dioscorea cayenensis subsp. rotundata]XP_039125832.1 transcription factor IIIB 60 kDa subunit isoform X2 [Dioscorea cayenensis subsp. rotundata]